MKAGMPKAFCIENALTRHGGGALSLPLGSARDFACGFPPQCAKTARPGGPGKRPQNGSISTRAYAQWEAAQSSQ